LLFGQGHEDLILAFSRVGGELLRDEWRISRYYI
jgi:hypothetical protein